MTSCPEIFHRWSRIVDTVRAEFLQLSSPERDWMEHRLRSIGLLQEQLQALFLQAGGDKCCADCLGACCDCGKNHLTLVNLLGLLQAGATIPRPDFTAPCPFLGLSGCLLPASFRPFNCVTFNCEQVENRMTPAEREEFYDIERRLRQLYTEFDARYAGAGLSGLFIRQERLAGQAFLARKSA
ncbi:MAG: hypothetical protein SCI25_08165 [Desulfuromonadales bacterium]|nr:hypothetical protein [Desulfuromonadales bacterium]MDW7757076.1 hypothetical protein [Desulfuromonadales bacterium]